MTTTSSNSSTPPLPTEINATKRLRARLGSLFVPKNAHLAEPQIEFDEPWRTYTRGDVVKGKVVLHVTKPLGVSHLTLSLFGYLEVFKNHSRSQPGLRTNAGRVASGKGKRWVTEYYGDGFASLFEHEATLCGEGRLDPNVYHFKFEVAFPSDRDLPTSIKFERGTVAYGVAATITRPTTIAPTMTAIKAVQYQQTIDVARLRTPKPRVATVEMVASTPRSNMVRRLTSASTSIGEERPTSQLSQSSKFESQRTVAAPTLEGDAKSPASPVPSIPSTMSVSSVDPKDGPALPEPRSSHSSHDTGILSHVGTGKTLTTATITLQKAGALPGDLIQIQIHIHHARKIRSPAGIVSTLYRQARVDMHPHIREGGMGVPGKSKGKEDYYPRSKSGIGGLSLSAAGSSQVWRKDLAQTVSPLYVDEQSMTAVIKTAIRIPEDAFATMSNAPGNMIMFKYYVEVLIDIHGRWAGRTGMPESGVITAHSAPPSIREETADDPRSKGFAYDTGPFFNPPITKNTIKFHCEVVVGNKDSSKSVGKQKQAVDPTRRFSEEQQLSHVYSSSPHRPHDYHHIGSGHDHSNEEERRYDHPSYSGEVYNNFGNMNDPHPPYEALPSANANAYRDPLQLPMDPEEPHLSEKERLRRAEATLLPSRPPGGDGTQSTSQILPSAPFLEEDDIGIITHPSHQLSPNTSRQASFTQHSTSPTVAGRQHEDGIFSIMLPEQPAPSYSDAALSRSRHTEGAQFSHVPEYEERIDVQPAAQTENDIVGHGPPPTQAGQSESETGDSVLNTAQHMTTQGEPSED